MELCLVGFLAVLTLVGCHGFIQVPCKFPDVKGPELGFVKVAAKENIKLSKRQSSIKTPAAHPRKYAGAIWEGTRASESCGEWLKPKSTSPFLNLCTERRTFTQTGNYVIYKDRFCLVSRPFNSFKYPSVECVNKVCKNVKIGAMETYRCVPGGARVYSIPVLCINKGRPKWYLMPMTVSTYCCCNHYVCPGYKP